MASAPTILGKRIDDIQSDVGIALLIVKNTRGLRLIEMAGVMGRSEDAVAKYISGEYEMGFIAWERAKDEWPELVGIIEETAADRDARARQRELRLAPPQPESEAA